MIAFPRRVFLLASIAFGLTQSLIGVARAQEYAQAQAAESALKPAVTAAEPGQEGALRIGFHHFVEDLGRRAVVEGVSKRTVDSVVPSLSYNSRVIALDRNQPGASDPNAPIPKFEPYRQRHVDRERIWRGRETYRRLRPLLARFEAQTGVPESVMIAIFGHETNYGAYTGDFDLARSLATLAYEGRRRELFSNEFIATLRLMDRGFPRHKLVGSWAGATGYPQFLPSVYLRMARDGDGDGIVDIWSSEADAVASIGNYLRLAGWQRGLPWGASVIVPSALDRNTIKPLTISPRCERVHARHSRWLAISEWRALGVIETGVRRLPDNAMATLIEPDGPGSPAYLTTINYRAILDYNCSNFYALSVGLLADQVEG